MLVGAWIPLLVGQAVTSVQASLYAATHSWWSVVVVEESLRRDELVRGLPRIVELVQRIGIPSLVVLIAISVLLPSRPREFGRSRTLAMLAQWLLPVTAIAYTSASSFTSQARLLLGRYRERFGVTEKHAAAPVAALPVPALRRPDPEDDAELVA